MITVSALALTVPAFAQDTPPQEGADSAPAKDIVVTGSRIPGRTIAESPVPIDVISGDQLAASGQTETNKVLNQLVPSFNFPQPSLTDGTDSLRPATLRGLAPDQTLVLINGKRRSDAAPARSTSTKFRRSRSTGSKCCATAPRRNMARTRSPA